VQPGHLYPWQWLTRRHRIRLTHRLAPRFDPERLRDELQAITDRYRLKRHFKSRDGGVDDIALVAAHGDPSRDRKEDGPYQKTEVLCVAPYLEEIIDSLRCAKKRVRILRLAPGGRVPWHYDWDESLDYGNGRLHVPIETNQRGWSQLSHVDYIWQPGELWYGDFSFPHRLGNRGDRPRVHLVIDVVRNDFVDECVGPFLAEAPEPRARVRGRAQWLMKRLHERPRKRWRRLVSHGLASDLRDVSRSENRL